MLIVLSVAAFGLSAGLIFTLYVYQHDSVALRTEIEELKLARKPLILETAISTFSCTGSMEPTFGCTDSATKLLNPRAEDIVIGSLFSYSGLEDCEDAIHRVVDVKVINGVHYYQEWGDAAGPPGDGCWVPESHVTGYLIELHKDTHPQNGILRAHVNLARAETDAAIEEYEALRLKMDAVYEKLQAAYEKEDCWGNLALDAKYFDDRPPVYPYICPTPIPTPDTSANDG